MTRALMTRRAATMLAAALFVSPVAFAKAEEPYPNRPITMLVGFAPGGGTDIVARLVMDRVSRELGQPVLIENRAGASGTIAASAASRADPDGYTLLMGHVSSNAMVPPVLKVNYDPVADFTPIATLGSVPQVIAVPASSPAKDMAGFLAMLTERGDKVSYASSGLGTQQHLAAELFKQATGARMIHIPYKGSGQAVNDLIAGVVDVNFDTLPTVLPHIKAGKLRALAVTTAKRTSIMPDLPTVAETGIPGYDVNTWYMAMGPKALPKPIVERLNAAINVALADPKIRERLTEMATEIGGGTPADAEALLRHDVAKWAKVVDEAGISAAK